MFKKEAGKFQLFASGVIVSIDKNIFIFSAGHVFDDPNIEIWTTGKENEFVRIGGEIISNDVLNRNKDKIDLCLIKLNEDTLRFLLDSYIPIEKNELGVNHHVKELPIYYTLGYPVTRTKNITRHQYIQISAFEYITIGANKTEYDDADCNQYENIVFKYDKIIPIIMTLCNLALDQIYLE
ncbi:MAG: hypothetical protein IPK08_17185 [Bacteroidetes bacterium]|nr:hypothetical protein [Bacteroidota bacterium]